MRSNVIKWTLVALTLVLIVTWFALGFVGEPLRVQIWEALKWGMPLLGGIGWLTILILVFGMKEKVHSALILSTILSTVCLVTPTLSQLLWKSYPAKISNTEQAISVRLPMNEEMTVAWGGDTVRENYHAAYPDQRWAYDLIVEPHSSNSKNLDDYGCFGKFIVAPVAGEIRTAHDGEEDRVPDENAADIQNAYGNYIVLKPHDNKNRVIIAHLKKNSVIVQRGDNVIEGQRLAACGNSGNSTEPHVHIHYVQIHETGDDILLTGLPMFFRDHNGAPMPTGGYSKINGQTSPIGDRVRHISR